MRSVPTEGSLDAPQRLPTLGPATPPYGPLEIVRVIVPVYVPAWASAGILSHAVTAMAIAPMPLVVEALATVVGAHPVPLVPHVAVTVTG